MLNLDSLNGLSYQKGCYPGQEVVARLHFRGEVKKRLSLIRSDRALNDADKLLSKEAEHSIGTIINHAQHPDGSCYALAVIDLNMLDNDLYCEGNTEEAITIMEFPYAIDA